MRGLWIMMAAAACAAGLATAPASAATVLDVNWTADCGKSTCFNDQGVYTRTWSAANASGPMTIGQFLMDRGVLGDLDGQTFRISFTIGGQEVGTWGKFTMGGIGGDQLNFAGENFVWNPEDGDLQLVLTIIPPPKGGVGGGMSLVTDAGEDSPFAPPQGGGQNGVPNGPVAPHSLGGEASPQGGQVGGVPEPTTWALMIGGFGLAGASLRRRRAVTVRA